MSSIPMPPPEQLLQALKATARPQKQRNLDVVHAVCAELHRLGSRDFVLATVGRMAHERGGPAPRTLYTAQSQDFRTLVDAWAMFSRASGRQTPAAARPFGDSDLLHRIDDPALRTLISAIVAERDRLRSQINVLRANANVVIDRRPLPGALRVDAAQHVVQVLSPSQALTGLEREALERAVSAKFLAQEGWIEGVGGELANAKGRRLYEHGYTTAIRKLLADNGS